MTTPSSSSRSAKAAKALVDALQQRLARRLEAVAEAQGAPHAFEPVSWLRDEGRHGGGVRLVCADTPVFQRASVNVSAIHYDDLPAKKLASATALSAIVHPSHPLAPSMHMHISWTELRSGRGGWRVMADLNPSHPHEAATTRFAEALARAAPRRYAEAKDQGDRYFHIPALGRHRGVTHYYLESVHSGDVEADRAMASAVGEAAIDTYGAIVEAALRHAGPATEAQRETQLAYHTLYLFQVLTLDRGTTSGLLVHSQNDVGILGSLPAQIDRDLLASWADRLPSPQEQLLARLVSVFPTGDRVVSVDTAAKRALARVVREHYQQHPQALALQASGHTIPPTVANHR